MTRFTLLQALTGALLATGVVAQTFEGAGTISVLNSSSFDTATPADSIGCLNAYGLLTLDDCATFTRAGDYPYGLSSDVGNCTFFNASSPKNTDSAYGNISHAFSCSTNWNATVSDELYTISGFNYPFLCNGDTSCYYDVKSAPTTKADREDVWRYIWGSEQTGITPGHIQVLWLWVARS